MAGGHTVLGQPNTKWRGAHFGSRKIASSTNSGVTVASKTYITAVPTGFVALIDKIAIVFSARLTAATNETLTITLNSQSMRFLARRDAATHRMKDYSIYPNGSLVVTEGNTLTMSCTTDFTWFTQVEYRLVPTVWAIQFGYLPGVPFVASAVVAAGATDLITSATVTPKRGLDVRGVAITGTQQNAAAGAAQEIMVGFWEPGVAVERKILKNCYGTASQVGTHDLIISNGRFRGPLGAISGTDASFGIRCTAGQATNAVVTVWGFFYPYFEGQKTWPGTGVPPAADTTAYTGGDYWWMFTEQVASGAVNVFPATSIAGRNLSLTIDGWCGSIAAQNGTGVTMTFGVVSPALTVGCPIVYNAIGGAAGDAGAVTKVFENMNMPWRSDIGPLALALAVLGGANPDKASFTAWGRFGGPSMSDGFRSSTYLTVS